MKNLVHAFSRDLDMPIEDFIAFRDFILEKSGIYFAENKMYLLTERLSRRMVFNSVSVHSGTISIW